MSLSQDDVRRIARLARIAVSDDEVVASQSQLNQLFALIEEMRAVDTDGIEPMAHAQDVMLRLREDAATAPNRRESFQAVAPSVENGLYLVPKVIE
ncbi:Asp-tRNA(Asn)/Glu-tRNA(Gln) amidotransferase subunit GatC [Chitinibacter bivalviorum]|uniref:Aspartyl/glutamyl-tRNA(Asn/Gln) amidotransferase subunit C n=1 Tax=Chitinibacter bivalviorum TaxID=2739434 RepID=A0A7H9BK88_9NEIS|nr:Asp-tRNA(Asn)/Glu-tRNA(Gln) amidotransferase subunit GatC [Chitinibacter bivalviorum]QLG88782.1 Asp-tRNA(Asn)/Glu-tRNA(Gln) amidotransferase subunit GatC [Chitinibacter bivalviorum]